MADQELRLKAKAEGFEDAARKIDKVDDAQKTVVEGTKAGNKETKAATEAQAKRNASTDDHISLLTRLSPTLGGFVDGLVRGGKVAGDFAKQQINVRGATRKATSAIRNNAAALKLIGAGGAVVAAIGLIVKSVQAMWQSYERVNKAIERDNELLAEQTRKAKELAKAYMEATDARRRFERISAEQAAQGSAQVTGVAKRFGLEGKEGVLAKVATDVAGAGVSQEDLVQLQLAAAAGADVSLPMVGPGVQRHMVKRLLARPDIQRAAEATRQRARDQMRLLQEAARKELTSTGAADNLAEYLSRTQGVDIERAREVAAKAQKISATSPRELDELTRGFFNVSVGSAYRYATRGAVDVDSATEQNAIGLPLRVSLEARELAEIRALLNSLLDEARQSRIDAGPTTMIVNPRMVYPDAATQRRNTVNGETTARQAERIP